MQATYAHEGDYIDYTPASAVTAGDVIVLGNLLCLAQRDIAANVLGALCVRYVADFPKANGDSFSVGQDVYWNTIADQIKSVDSGGDAIYAGKVVKTAASADGTVRVRVVNN